MNIGQTIRALRKERGLTQEQLACAIGVSFQAVSKWENHLTLPDITLAPVIASYFGITMDELFDFDLKEIQADIEKITDEAYRHRESDPAKSREILCAGLSKYPENDSLLNNLLYVMNYSENPDETIKVASHLIEKTSHHDVKYDALRFLAYAYKAKGDLESAEKAIEQIPEIYFTKLTELAYLLQGKKKFEAADKQKWISFENLIQMMNKVGEYYEEIGENAKAVQEYETALALIGSMDSANYDNYRGYFLGKVERLK